MSARLLDDVRGCKMRWCRRDHVHVVTADTNLTVVRGGKQVYLHIETRAHAHGEGEYAVLRVVTGAARLRRLAEALLAEVGASKGRTRVRVTREAPKPLGPPDFICRRSRP